MRLGVVDLGTNSLRFAIYEVPGRGLPKCIYKRKLMLRTGQGVYSAGRLKPQTIRKVVTAFKRFRRQADRFHVEKTMAVGTSALREASNSSQLLRKVKRKTGVALKIISGQEEARLIATGILHFSKRLRDCLLIDIGGGSTELSICRNGRRIRSISLPLGALRLQQLFLPKSTLKNVEQRLGGVATLQTELRTILQVNLEDWHTDLTTAIGSSGTARAVARLIRSQSRRISPKFKGELKFAIEELRELVENMLLMSKAELSHMPGMEQKRLDNILGGAILLLNLMDHLRLREMRTSQYALRDGLLATFMSSRKHGI